MKTVHSTINPSDSRETFAICQITACAKYNFGKKRIHFTLRCLIPLHEVIPVHQEGGEGVVEIDVGVLVDAAFQQLQVYDVASLQLQKGGAGAVHERAPSTERYHLVLVVLH